MTRVSPPDVFDEKTRGEWLQQNENTPVSAEDLIVEPDSEGMALRTPLSRAAALSRSRLYSTAADPPIVRPPTPNRLLKGVASLLGYSNANTTAVRSTNFYYNKLSEQHRVDHAFWYGGQSFPDLITFLPFILTLVLDQTAGCRSPSKPGFKSVICTSISSPSASGLCPLR